MSGFTSPAAKALKQHGGGGGNLRKVGGVFQNGNVAKLREMFEKKVEEEGGGGGTSVMADTLNALMREGGGPHPGAIPLPGLTRRSAGEGREGNDDMSTPPRSSFISSSYYCY